MMITAVIFTLSIALFLAYTFGMKRVMQARLLQNESIDGSLDEELIMDMAEYKQNVQKLGLMSIGIAVCFALSFVIR
jgi:hypothetical protein